MRMQLIRLLAVIFLYFGCCGTISVTAANVVAAAGQSAAERLPINDRPADGPEVEREKSRISRRATSPTGSRLTQDQRAEFLYEHNRLRQTVNPAASDMLKMVWNGELESMAQQWADACDWKHGQPSRLSTPFAQIGQNLWAGSGPYSPTLATDAWFNEIKFYSYDSNACAAGEVCGHYTQVAWAKSYALGCGISYCPQISSIANGHYIVCNYGPAGNYVGEKPYQTGAACSACPPTNSTCDSGLCRADPFCSAVTECSPINVTYCLCDESVYLSAYNGSGSSTPVGCRLPVAAAAVAALAIVHLLLGQKQRQHAVQLLLLQD